MTNLSSKFCTLFTALTCTWPTSLLQSVPPSFGSHTKRRFLACVRFAQAFDCPEQSWKFVSTCKLQHYTWTDVTREIMQTGRPDTGPVNLVQLKTVCCSTERTEPGSMVLHALGNRPQICHSVTAHFSLAG